MSPAVFFIIEHPTRGTLREMDHDWRDGKAIDIPRFSSTGTRNDPEKAMQFFTLQQAQSVLDRIVLKGSKSDQKCVIRRSPNFDYWCTGCGRWIDQFMQAENGHSDACPKNPHRH